MATDPARTWNLTVSAVETLAHDVVRLTLEDPDGAPLPAWSPGAHIDLVLGPDLVRQYSLCGAPSDRDRWQIAVLREPDGRGGSSYIHANLRVGSTVAARGPRNHFRLVESSRYLFIAGGIGITPLLPMLRAAESAGAEWQLLYGGRSRQTMAFIPELASYGDRVVVVPEDEFGLLDIAGSLAGHGRETAIYCCGPEPLLQAVETAHAGSVAGSLHVERFAAKNVIDHNSGLETFEVICKRSGLEVTVSRGISVLDALKDAGADVVSSCGEGTCGTCETEVIEGRPDHRDSFLTADERESDETMCICVSRSLTSRLVLDI